MAFVQRYTYRIDLAYDGAAFAGFARQPGQRTVEGQLLQAWRPLIAGLPCVSCGGRTDRGVHALRQTVSIWSRARLQLAALEQSADAALDGAGWVLAAQQVPRSFHARFSALGRHYLYLLDGSLAGGVAQLDAMLRALVGERCLSAFARQTPAGTRTVRRILAAGARRSGSGRVCIELIARGFMKRQVRVTVATALRELARGSDAGVLLRLAAAGDRRATAPPAPADRLYLARVLYPDDVGHLPNRVLTGTSDRDSCAL